MTDNTIKLFSHFQEKSLLKQDVYRKTLTTFKKIKEIISTISKEYADYCNQMGTHIPFQMKGKSEFEIELHYWWRHSFIYDAFKHFRILPRT